MKIVDQALSVGAGALLVLCACLSGCGDSKIPPPSATLAGVVKLGAAPIETGRIHFMPTGSGQGQPVTAEITAGQYRADQVPLGAVRVTFTANKSTGENSRGYRETESTIPPDYAQGISLEVSGDSLSQDFVLQAK
jgi:hypothetical protein